MEKGSKSSLLTVERVTKEISVEVQATEPEKSRIEQAIEMLVQMTNLLKKYRKDGYNLDDEIHKCMSITTTGGNRMITAKISGSFGS